MKTLTVGELNRRTSEILDSVVAGEVYELRRNGKCVAYLSRTRPAIKDKPDWSTHFAWLRKQKPARRGPIQDLEDDRRRCRESEQNLEKLL